MSKQVAEANHRRVWTPEMREHMSAVKSGQENGFYGKRHTSQTRRVMSGKAAENRIRLGYPGRLRRFGIPDELYLANWAKGVRYCQFCKDFLPFEKFERERPDGKTACNDHLRHYDVQKKFGVSPDWLDAKMAEQGGVCALCGERPRGRRKYLCVDHNHRTEVARGLLCVKCNTALERLDCIPGWAEKAMAYLARYESRPAVAS